MADGSTSNEGSPPAVLNCRCGSVQLLFHHPKVVSRVDDCCKECEELTKWFEKRGGWKNPIPRNKDLCYLPNDLTVAHGCEHLKFYIARDKGNPRYVADCCSTVLGMLHPAYRGNVVLVYNDSGVLTNAEMIEQQVRLFQYDLSASELAALPPCTVPVARKLPWGLFQILPLLRAWFFTKVSLPRKGSSMEDLLLAHGPPINLQLDNPLPEHLSEEIQGKVGQETGASRL